MNSHRCGMCTPMRSPHCMPGSVKQLTVQESTVRYADKSEAWASEVTTLEDCTESAVDLKKIQ